MALRHRRDLVTEPGVIVVDGVYINGAVARLAEVVEVAEASGSVLVVDETHSFGVTPGGLGVCEEVGVVDRVHFRAIGLSKACASRGGAFSSVEPEPRTPPTPQPVALRPSTNPHAWLARRGGRPVARARAAALR